MAENIAQGINTQGGNTQEINTQEAGSHSVSVSMNKLTEGIGILFTGVLKMLEALGPNTARDLVENFVCTDEAPTVNSGKKEEAKVADDSSVLTTPAAAADAPPTTPATEPTASKKKGKSKASKKEPGTEESSAEAPQPEQAKPAAPSVTVDDVARIVVQKVKANPGINDKIRALVNTYGAPRVTELKPEVLEAFLTDLAQL